MPICFFQVFVLKQSWQRLPGQEHDQRLNEIPFERYAYEKAGFARHLRAAEYVCSSTTPVTTFKFIRKGLKGTGLKADSNLGSKRKTMGDPKPSDEKSKPQSGLHSNEPFIYKQRILDDELDFFIFSDVTTQPVSRTQARIIMNIRGWALKSFKNLIELLQAIRGAVLGLLPNLIFALF